MPALPSDSDAGRALDAAGFSVGMDPHLAPFLRSWLDTFVFHGRVDARLREVAILRIMWRCDRAFEWGNHYRLARSAGLSREEILAVRADAPGPGLDPSAAVAAQAADEVIDAGTVSAPTMARLGSVFPEPAQLDEFLYVVAGYRMFATVSASRGDDRASSHPPWPPDGRSPLTS